jgi:glycosyltransferase involved in cell wall biosynthesis
MALRVGFNARVLSDPGTRGLSRYTTNLLRALSSTAEIRLFLFASEPPVASHLSGIDAEVVVLPARRESVWEAWTLPEALRAAGIEIFHAPADRGLPLQKTCPFVVTVHDSFEREHWRSLFPSLRRRYWYWKGELVNRLCADAVITVSDTTKRDLSRLGIAPESRIWRTHLAPADEFTCVPQASDMEVMRKYGLSKPYFLYVGGYDARKNVDFLIRAFDASRLSTHRLVVVARKGRDFVRQEASWRDLRCFQDLVLIEAPNGELPSLYRRAQAFINPSLWESFSFQTVEAMACGAPLAASNRKAIPEIAGEAAVYFDPENLTELVGTMNKMASDPDLRARLNVRGLERVKQFDWRRTAEETARIYETVRRPRH